jgi:hypothetical protein
MRYRAPWFFCGIIFYGTLTAPLVVGVAILITVLSRKEEFFFAPDALRLKRQECIANPTTRTLRIRETPLGFFSCSPSSRHC